jgi:glutaconate CoA-transferase subunit B
VASFVGRTIIFMQHEKRKFVNRLDYLTSPGWLQGSGRREQAGLAAGGPAVVITNMAVMAFDDTTREMYLMAVFPGISPPQVLDHMEFEVDISRAQTLPPPSAVELAILREKCDPQRLILG